MKLDALYVTALVVLIMAAWLLGRMLGWWEA